MEREVKEGRGGKQKKFFWTRSLLLPRWENKMRSKGRLKLRASCLLLCLFEVSCSNNLSYICCVFCYVFCCVFAVSFVVSFEVWCLLQCHVQTTYLTVWLQSTSMKIIIERTLKFVLLTSIWIYKLCNNLGDHPTEKHLYFLSVW